MKVKRISKHFMKSLDFIQVALGLMGGKVVGLPSFKSCRLKKKRN